MIPLDALHFTDFLNTSCQTDASFQIAIPMHGTSVRVSPESLFQVSPLYNNNVKHESRSAGTLNSPDTSLQSNFLYGSKCITVFTCTNTLHLLLRSSESFSVFWSLDKIASIFIIQEVTKT